jgi:hypothetical protein
MQHMQRNLPEERDDTVDLLLVQPASRDDQWLACLMHVCGSAPCTAPGMLDEACCMVCLSAVQHCAPARRCMLRVARCALYHARYMRHNAFCLLYIEC